MYLLRASATYLISPYSRGYAVVVTRPQAVAQCTPGTCAANYKAYPRLTRRYCGLTKCIRSLWVDASAAI